MAMTITSMRRLIKANGHLQMDGKEDKEELREAILNLHKHSLAACRMYPPPDPMNHLLPDVTVAYPAPSTRNR